MNNKVPCKILIGNEKKSNSYYILLSDNEVLNKFKYRGLRMIVWRHPLKGIQCIERYTGVVVDESKNSHMYHEGYKTIKKAKLKAKLTIDKMGIDKVNTCLKNALKSLTSKKIKCKTYEEYMRDDMQ